MTTLELLIYKEMVQKLEYKLKQREQDISSLTSEVKSLREKLENIRLQQRQEKLF